MKAFLISIFSGSLMMGLALAQESIPPASGSTSPQAQPSTPAQTQQPQAQTQTSTPQNQATRIAPGSVIPVELTKAIDVKKAKTGEEIVAKVTQDMKTNSGEVLVPKDTKVVGHITEAQPHSKEQKESEVGIAFDRAVMKNGSEMQMPMSIQAIIAPPNSNPGNASGGYDRTTGTSGTAASPSGMGGRSAGAGSNSTPPPANNMPTDASSTGQGASGARPPITGNTQGVVGIPDLTLVTSAPTPAQGSLVSSDKNNVRLESGTMMLLRVNQ